MAPTTCGCSVRTDSIATSPARSLPISRPRKYASATTENAVTLKVTLRNPGATGCVSTITPLAYPAGATASRHELAAAGAQQVVLALAPSKGWYDFSVALEGQPAYSRRFAGRLETGSASVSDPAMHGSAIGEQVRRA